MIRAALALIIPFLIVGYLNAQDIKKCESLGNSYETCIATFNP